MIRTFFALIITLAITACVSPIAPTRLGDGRTAAVPVEIQILAFNDFHGNIETPPPVDVWDHDGTKQRIQTGGAAHLAAALAGLRVGHANTITVSAGDTIGA